MLVSRPVKMEKVHQQSVQQSSNGSSFNDNNDVNLAIRIQLHGREVGNVFGEGGETVKNITDQSGARVSISDSSTPECIGTITGTLSAICKATELIGIKVKEGQNVNCNDPKTRLTFKLIVPTSQCGFIIGKNACKLKEITNSSGAIIQVAADMLPNSTDRLVSITGTTGTISQCVYQVCNVLLDVKMKNVQQSSDGSSFNDYNDVNLTIRILFHGIEVGNVFGEGGETVKNITDQSGARVSISDSSTPECIGTITGTLSAICKATELIGIKVKEGQNVNCNDPKTRLTFKLIVPTSQCGFIIGKNACKLKEITNSSGAIIQVAADMLPNSTDRLVSITGTTGTISQCVYQVCNVLLDVKMKNVQQSSDGSSFNDYNDVNLTIRILFHGIEVGNVFGEGGETVKNITDQSGARVSISDSSTPECIGTITGTLSAICKATELIGIKVKEGQNVNCNDPKTRLTFKLIVPTSQCGFIIGKNACKLKEITNSSGAIIQVAADMLPNSTDRLVSITGTTGTISQCVYQVCNVLLDSLQFSGTIPYDPRSKTSEVATCAVGNECSGGEHNNQNSNSNTEIICMTVPNALIGCVFGKGGWNISEIEKLSGAIVDIAKNGRPHKNGKNEDRYITITGNKDSISVAKKLIEKRVELKKANLEEANSFSSPDDGFNSTLPTNPTVETSPLSSSIPLAQQFVKQSAESKSDNFPPLSGTIPYDPRSKTSEVATCAVGNDFGRQRTNPLASLAALGIGTASTGGINPAAALAGSQLRTGNCQNLNGGGEHKNQNSNSNTETISMTLPNDLIECIIGGSKIAEIQQKSGALVHIAKDEETLENGENEDRIITITGNKDSISVAKNLIEKRVKLQTL